MSVDRFYHATDLDTVARMLTGDFFRETSHHDAGDFGAGIYVTTDVRHARQYMPRGGVVLVFDVELERFALITDPYKDYRREGRGDAARLFGSVAGRVRLSDPIESLPLAGFDWGRSLWGRYPEVYLGTLQGPDRVGVARAVRKAFLDVGYAGIATKLYGSETVIFNPTTITRISVLPESAW